MSQNTQAGPLELGERHLSLDVLRGFALLGVLVMNLPGFAESFWLGSDGSIKWQAWWDQGAVALTDTLCNGKFNALFTLLFALGLSLQSERLQGAAAPQWRRLGWLFVFGLLHAVLLWHGDVLHMYALLGLLLLLLQRAPQRLIVALFLLTLLWVPARAIWHYSHWDPAQMQAWVALWQLREQADNQVFGSSSWWATVVQRTREMAFFYTHPSLRLGLLSTYISLFSSALLGLWLARRGWLTRPQPSQRPALWRAARWLLLLGVALGLYFALFSPGLRPTDPPSLFRASLGLAYTLSRLAVMLFYALALALLASEARNQRWLWPPAQLKPAAGA